MDKMLKMILDSSFSVEFNMNDTFHWACSDSCEMCSDDLKDLLPVIEKHGYNAIIAYEALKRGYDPDKEMKVVDKNYKAAKKEIEELLNIETKLSSLHEIVEIRKEEKELFNGQEIKYAEVRLRGKDGWNPVRIIAYLDSGERTVGDNKYHARKNLIEMWKDKNKYLKDL